MSDDLWRKRMLPISNVAVTAPLIDIAYGDSSLQLVGGYPCGGSRPLGQRTRRSKRGTSGNFRGDTSIRVEIWLSYCVILEIMRFCSLERRHKALYKKVCRGNCFAAHLLSVSCAGIVWEWMIDCEIRQNAE